jgi:hypothetical protein
MTDLIWSFAPWLAFLLGTRVTSLYGAVAAGVAVAAVVAVRAVARHRLHLLDAAGLCYFLALGAVLVIVHPGHLEFWSRYAQAGSHIALTVIVFGSILVGHPFTESYARQTAPAAVWRPASSTRSTGASQRSGDWRSWPGPSPCSSPAASATARSCSA